MTAKSEVNPLQKCFGCKTALYCNRQCDDLGWKDHRGECDGIKRNGILPDIEVRMLGRIVLRYKDILDRKNKTNFFYKDRTSRRDIMDLCHHTETMRADNYAYGKFDDIYKRLIEFYRMDFLLSKETIFGLHCRNYINRHGISDSGYKREIGKGLYLDLCQYNHSCRPNAVYTHYGFISTLRALDDSVDLNDIDNTFYSYIELSRPRQERQLMLKDSWYFECRCARCTDETDHLSTSIKCPYCEYQDSGVETPLCIYGRQSYKDPISGDISCPTCKRHIPRSYISSCLDAMKDLSAEMRKESHLKPPDELLRLARLEDYYSRSLTSINIYYCAVLQKAITLTDPANIESCLRLLLLTEPCVRVSYPSTHPGLGFHLNKISYYYLSFHDYSNAFRYAKEANIILSGVMDARHELLQENTCLLNLINTHLNKEKMQMANLEKIRNLHLNDPRLKSLRQNPNNIRAIRAKTEAEQAINATGNPAEETSKTPQASENGVESVVETVNNGDDGESPSVVEASTQTTCELPYELALRAAQKEEDEPAPTESQEPQVPLAQEDKVASVNLSNDNDDLPELLAD
ncbi:unnamed protein product [Auanema sp. JU1783]|nr:unnamed protein product [Auanema sp. JU1783]